MTTKIIKIAVIIFPVLFLWPVELSAQKFIERDGYVKFYSEAPVENIEAENNAGLSIFNRETGEIAFTIPIKKFQFKKSLMQQHFNENYMESDKFPNGIFEGKIIGFEITGDEQNLTARGTLTIHGVSNEVEVEGTGILKKNTIILKSVFPVRLEDYNIKIPKVVVLNIAEVVDVTIEFEYEPYDN